MTSVASYAGATTAGNYTLLVSGSTVGKWVIGYNTETSRLTPVSARTSFWSTVTKLDGSYPALLYKHEITIYTEPSSITLDRFAEAFHQLSNQFLGSAVPLAIVSGYTPVTTIYFGTCWMAEPPKLMTPDTLLMFAAGIVKLQFMGNTAPTVTTA